MQVRGRNLRISKPPAEHAGVMARSIRRRSANFATPDWAKTIVRLRKQLGFHQATFGIRFIAPLWRCRDGSAGFRSHRRILISRWVTPLEIRCAGISGVEL